MFGMEWNEIGQSEIRSLKDFHAFCTFDSLLAIGEMMSRYCIESEPEGGKQASGQRKSRPKWRPVRNGLARSTMSTSQT
nr:hypothetical protein [uncultured Cohaesibacter sp.]